MNSSHLCGIIFEKPLIRSVGNTSAIIELRLEAKTAIATIFFCVPNQSKFGSIKTSNTAKQNSLEK